MHENLIELEKKLWSAADELRANSELKSSEYSVTVLGLIFLRYADVKFAKVQQELQAKVSKRRTVRNVDYFAKGDLRTRWHFSATTMITVWHRTDGLHSQVSMVK